MGVLSLAQVEKGDAVLDQISALLDGTGEGNFTQLTSQLRTKFFWVSRKSFCFIFFFLKVLHSDSSCAWTSEASVGEQQAHFEGEAGAFSADEG